MNISKITDKHFCVGCGLCVSDAGRDKLKMIEQADGFLIPIPQNGFNGELSTLRNYCPGITVSLKRPLRNPLEKLYGPFIDLKVGHAIDEQIRFRGSSGGCLTALLCALVEQRKISGVLHIGASVESPTKTQYCFSKTVEEITENAGSRYAPTSLLLDFKKILAENDQIALVGKPCDIVAATQFIEIHPEYAEKVYCTLSFMCMGLPSQNATDRLLKKMGINNIDHVLDLKYRGNGWPGKASVLTKTGKSYSCSYDESWGQVLGRDVLFRCKICPDGWGSFADISAGDAWYTDGQGPLFHEKPGRSFLFVRTFRGKEIIENSTKHVALHTYNIAELPIIQKSQHTRKNRVWAFYLVLKILGDRLLNFKGIGMWSRILKSSPFNTARDTLGFFKRIPH